MSVTYGFYNTKLYDAIQMASIFDGIILDGVFQHYGNRFMVRPNNGMQIKVETGRAWFNHTWTLNDANFYIDIESPPSGYDMKRIDTVVLDIDTHNSVLKNSIKVVKGVESRTPVAPTLVTAGLSHNQYPLADILLKSSSADITESDITIRVGTSMCPYVTAPLEKMNVDDLIAQWKDQFNTWFSKTKDETNVLINGIKLEWTTWFNAAKKEFSDWFSFVKEDFDAMSTEITRLGNLIDDNYAALKAYTDTRIGNLITSAPETLDTLGEIADAIKENEDVVDALNDAIVKKVDKVSGKGLSTNDFTNAYKNKLDNLDTSIAGYLPLSGGDMLDGAFIRMSEGGGLIAEKYDLSGSEIIHDIAYVQNGEFKSLRYHTYEGGEDYNQDLTDNYEAIYDVQGISFVKNERELFKMDVNDDWITIDQKNKPLVKFVGKNNQETGIHFINSDTSNELFVGIGGGGFAHGIYSYKLNRWIAYADASGVYLRGLADISYVAQTIRQYEAGGGYRDATFHWQEYNANGQNVPSWLFGATNNTDIYVVNPTKLSVKNAGYIRDIGSGAEISIGLSQSAYTPNEANYVLGSVGYAIKPMKKPIRELTQAEYDALSNSEKLNGVVYFIKDAT